MKDALFELSLNFLKGLIATPSLSRQEGPAAGLASGLLESNGIKVQRHLNNIWAMHPGYKEGQPSLLLNSHLDTVQATGAWTKDPFKPEVSGGKLYGLGSNDAGASLAALMATFIYFQKLNLPFNLIIAATAEEEISGHNGIESIFQLLGPVDLAIIGEPTCMELAVAEKGLLVLDCQSLGRAGHAARNEGLNAIYEAMPDMEWFRNFRFEKESEFLGPVKMSVTQVNAGYQHNVVPDTCSFVVDVRSNENYSNAELLEIIRSHVSCATEARSLRLNSSRLPEVHPLFSIARELNIPCYGSPTTSDQAVIPCTSVKMGPGNSARSHTADEYVELDELRNGIETYIRVVEKLVTSREINPV